MSSDNIQKQQTSAVTPSTGNPPPAANPPTDWDSLMAGVVESFETLASSVPGFVLPHKAGKKTIQPYLNVSEEFVGDTLAAIDETPVVGLGILDPVDARERLSRNRAIRAIVPRVRLIADGLEYTANADTADLVQRCQKVYGAVKTLARDPRATIVAVRARIMTASRGLLRKGKAADKKQPTPGQQQPQSTPTPHALKEAA